MPEQNFNTPSGQTIARELLIAYLNTGTRESPVWSPLGKRVEDSSAAYDWGKETKKDVLGNTYTSMKKPTVTQPFDPWELDSGDAAQQKIHSLAVVQQDAQAICNLDMMIAHFYSGNSAANFAERYDSCSVEVTSLGGEGGSNISMSTEVTYGGNRTIGTVSKGEDNSVVFAAAA